MTVKESAKRLYYALQHLKTADAKEAVTAVFRNCMRRKTNPHIFWGESEDGHPQVEIITDSCEVLIIESPRSVCTRCSGLEKPIKCLFLGESPSQDLCTC